MEALQALLQNCMDNYDVGDETAEWPNNMISRLVVFHDTGIFSLPGTDEKVPISDEEVELCRRLATQVGEIRGDSAIGMGSEGSEPMAPFWLVATEGEPVATHIDEHLIRLRFGGSLFPLVTIQVEAIAESGKFWGDIMSDAADLSGEDHNEYMLPWLNTVTWFKDQDEFKEVVFVYIGDSRELQRLDDSVLPQGTEMTPSCLPRLVVGLTEKGSVCGLFGFVVQT